MKRGFSLIELLVVVAIIAILVGVATPYYADYVRESKRAKALQDLDVLKQAIVLYNSQEDLPYQGTISTQSTELVPILGENDFNGLQGRYLTYIPVDPWGKNYKIDPFACFVYSEGPDSRVDSDDIKDYYVKDLALVRIEWEDTNNDRLMNPGDLLYFAFNKPLFAETFVGNDFNIYENNEIVDSTAVSASETISLTFTWKHQPAAETEADRGRLLVRDPPRQLPQPGSQVGDEPLGCDGAQRGRRRRRVGESPGATLLGEQVDGERGVARPGQPARH